MARVSAVFFGEHSSGFRSDVKVQSRFKGNPTPLREGLNGGGGGGGGAGGRGAPLIGCRLLYNSVVGVQLKFSVFVGCR